MVRRGPTPDRRSPAPPRRSPVARTFSLFYFAAARGRWRRRLRLLLDGARFADDNGFEAVWTPERHFHAFGGIYPNPAVTSAAAGRDHDRRRHPRRQRRAAAALAGPRRRRVGGRRQPLERSRRRSRSPPAGSRTTSCSTPARYEGAKERPRGRHRRASPPVARRDRVDARATSAPVDVRTFPGPVQPEIPLWLTSAGSIETFERAGAPRLQPVDASARAVDRAGAPTKIAAYRDAWRACRAPRRGPGHVDAAHVPRATTDDGARAAARPAAHRLPALGDEPVEGHGVGVPHDAQRRSRCRRVLPVAHARANSTSCSRQPPTGTWTPAASSAPSTTPQALVLEAVAAGVDEIACLVDFGVDAGMVRGGFDADRGAQGPHRGSFRRPRGRYERYVRRRPDSRGAGHAPAVHAVDAGDARRRPHRRRRARQARPCAHRRRGVHAGPRRRSADAAQRAAHQHVRADRDDGVVARPRGRAHTT